MSQLRPDQELENALAHDLGIVAQRDDPASGARKGAPWPDGDPATVAVERNWGGGNSENFAALEICLKYCRGVAGAGDRLVKWLLWQKTEGGFMGLELGTRIYGVGGHFLPVLMAYRKAMASNDTTPAALLGEWLDLWFSWCRLMRVAGLGSQVLMLGMRSAFHAPIPGLIEHSADIGLSAPGSPIPGPSPGMQPFERFTSPYMALNELTGAARVAAKRVREEPYLSGIAAAGPSWKTCVDVNLLVCPSGERACWVPRNANGNTPPVLGAVSLGSAVSWLPVKCGEGRIRQQFDKATCAASADYKTLVYTGDLYQSATAPLPASGTLYRLGRPEFVQLWPPGNP